MNSKEDTCETLLRDGEDFHEWKILEHVGSGGFAEVYRAESLGLHGKQVALKVFRLRAGRPSEYPASSKLPNYLEWSFQVQLSVLTGKIKAVVEAVRSKDSHHPILEYFVLPEELYEDIPVKGRYRTFYVSRYVQGTNIREHCRQKRCTINEIVALLKPVAELLDVLEKDYGIIYLDLKPQNIIVDASGKPYLIDIDLAFSVKDNARGNRESRSFTVDAEGRAQVNDADPRFPGGEDVCGMGTPRYFTPEQAFLDAPEYDIRSNVYAMALIFLELTTGRLPQFQRAICDVFREKSITSRSWPDSSLALNYDDRGSALKRAGGKRQVGPVFNFDRISPLRIGKDATYTLDLAEHFKDDKYDFDQIAWSYSGTICLHITFEGSNAVIKSICLPGCPRLEKVRFTAARPDGIQASAVLEINIIRRI